MYAVVRVDPTRPQPYRVYVTRQGSCTAYAPGARTFRTRAQAEAVAQAKRRDFPSYTWTVEEYFGDETKKPRPIVSAGARNREEAEDTV